MIRMLLTEYSDADVTITNGIKSNGVLEH
uniref:Uncharacterized protein n=1 Tax=Anguilla anguilla TaxID=7936 RepID=A0A0E9QEN6_ANGAN